MHFKLFKKMLDEWAVEQEPVFIVGPERSGTSLLFQQISNHPDFCDFSEATVETFCFSYPWKLFDPSTHIIKRVLLLLVEPFGQEKAGGKDTGTHSLRR